MYLPDKNTLVRSWNQNFSVFDKLDNNYQVMCLTLWVVPGTFFNKFDMKTFKEKKRFYKERQEIYDKVKLCQGQLNKPIELFGKIYQTSLKEHSNYVLIYCKRTKRPEIFDYYNDHKLASNLTDSIRLSSSRAKSSVLLWLSNYDELKMYKLK